MSENNNIDKKIPSISVIVPLYNVEPFIKDCLKSIASQDYEGDIECIIVDDCGTDGSLGIVQKFISAYKGPIDFKILYRKKNGGLSAARNDGLRHSKGEYVYFLDSDDELYTTALSSLAAPLSKRKYDFVIAGYNTIGTDCVMPQFLMEEGDINKDEIFSSYLLGKWYMMAVNKLCNRQFLCDSSLFFKEGIIHEDELWSFQLAAVATSMYVTHDLCYIYKIRSGSITTSRNYEKRLKALQTIYGEIISFINSRQLPVTSLLWNFLQSLFLCILKDVWEQKKTLEFSKVYKTLRSYKLYTGNSPYFTEKSLKSYLRDLHLFLPVSVSIAYQKVIVMLLSRKDSNIDKS